jgi:eukaryotic-like serine/threonine-protein kinase
VDQSRREAPAVSKPTNVPPSLAQGRYRLSALIGEGAKKRVYLAHDSHIDRDVAIAFLKAEGFDSSRLRRVHEEARAMARLGDHPRIVAVYDVGEEQGTPYIVAEYMAGGTVERLLAEAPDRRLPLEQAVRIADQVCQALAHAHVRGIIHRDLKPANVWLNRDGFAKLGDFGLAISLDRSGAASGRLIGTVAYISPEQALGRTVDERTDLYALGCMLYEMVTGRPPFVGKDAAAVIAAHVSETPQSPAVRNSSVPAPLNALILKLVRKAPAERPASAAEVREALAAAGVLPAGTATPAPNPLDFTISDDFIGRRAEIEKLTGRLEDSLAGRGRIVFLAGEPGIGKTRTSEEVAAIAARRGARVWMGRCHEGGGAPAFWPWVQILRGLIADPRMVQVIRSMGGRAADIAQLVPEVRAALPDLPAPQLADPEGARFRLFDCLTILMQAASRIEPMLLLLDDLHWADKSSLLLLQFLGREIGDDRLFVVGTYRDAEAQHGHPLAEILPTMREPVTTKILLQGLPEEEVRAFIGSVSRQQVSQSFARAIFRETEGNPFFIQEILRHLIEEGILFREDGQWKSRLRPDEMGLPESVREVIRRRFARLGERCRDVLTRAAVIGREFDTRVLEHVSDIAGDELLDVLDEALAARVIGEAPRSPGRYSFMHALIRETLTAELGATRRVRLHRKVGNVLESVYERDLEPHLAELAYHFFEASPGGDIDKAIDYSKRAGDRATSQFAFEEAVVHFQHALRALEHRTSATASERCELLLKVGEAHWSAAEFAASQEAFKLAAEIAVLPDQKARAALGFAGPYAAFTTGSVDETLVGLLETALAALPKEDSALRARLMGRLAEMFTFTPKNAEVRPLAREAVAMARRVGDKPALAHALSSLHWVAWSPDNLEERWRSTDEILAISLEIGDAQFEAMAHLWRVTEHLFKGDVIATAPSFAALERCGRTLPQPYLVWLGAMSRPLRPFLEGRLDESEQLAYQAVAVGQERENNNAAQLFGSQMIFLRHQQGRLEELVDAVKDFTQRFPTTHSWHCALAWILAQTGRQPEAREVIERLGRAGFADIPRDFLWLISAWWVAEAIADVDDARHAEPLYELMRPFADCWMSISIVICAGSVSRSLGRLATTLGRFDAAQAHFEQALAAHQRMGATLWLAHTRFEYAAMLYRRGDGADRARASELLGQALDAAHGLGLKALLEKSLALKLDTEGIGGADVRTSIDAITTTLEEQPPDLAAQAAPDGTVTLMFSDMEGFSAMTERLGDAAAYEVIKDHNEIIRSRMRTFGGFEVELLGDGFLIAFSSAARALHCAVEIQHAMRRYSEDNPSQPIRVRIGLHTGEPIREGDRFFGKTVILAARVAAQARGGEILVSSVLHQLVESGQSLAFGAPRDVTLKGLAGTHRVFPVDWDGTLANAPAEPAADAPAHAAGGEAETIFRHEGDFWTIQYDGRCLRLRDSKGLQYIAELLRRSGEDLHVTALLGAERGETLEPALGDAGEIVDPRAKAQYKARLDDLRSELEEAERCNDLERTSRMREEIDFITKELSAAFGLGGRSRKSADAIERMRKAVGSRIRDTISRIREEHPALGQHFTNALRLGVFCSYTPDKPVRWAL